MTPCTGNHSLKAPCDDPDCPKSRKVVPMEPETPMAKTEPDNVMVTLVILLARFLGLVQRTLGRLQTRLLTIAQSWGWQPDSRYAALMLQKRQVALSIREGMREVTRREARLKEQLSEETTRKKRFTKTYPSE